MPRLRPIKKLLPTKTRAPRAKPADECDESELTFSPVFHANPLPTSLTVLDTGRYIAVNEAWSRAFGFSQDEVYGKTSIELNIWVHPEERATMIQQIKATGAVHDFEHLARTKTGEVRSVLVSARVIEWNGTRYNLALVHDITARKRTEIRTQRQNAYLEALHQVTLGVIGELDVNELLATIVERVVELIDATYGLMYIVTPAKDALELCVATGVFRQRTGTRMEPGEGLSGRVWQTGEPLAVDDYHEWSGRSPYFDGAPVYAAMGVPLKSGGEVIGVLGLTRTTPNTPFDQWEQDVATRLGHLASIALVNARLHTSLQAELVERKRAEEELQHRLAFEQLITGISTEFINLISDEIDAGIEQALAAIGRFTGSDRSYVFLFSDDGTQMENIHEWCRTGILSLKQLYHDTPVDLLPWIAAQIKAGQIVHVPRVADLPPEAERDRAQMQSHADTPLSFINVPMNFQGQVIGLLGFDAVRVEKTWNEDTIALLRIVGEIFVSGLERKRAEQKIKEAYRTLEQRVAERTHELATLNAIAASVSRSLDLKEIMAQALEHMMNLTGMEHGIAYRLGGEENGVTDAERTYLRVMAYRGLPDDLTDLGDGLPLHQSAAGVAGRHGEPMIWSLAALPSQSLLKQKLAVLGVQQIIVIPLIAKGRLAGSLNLSTNQTRVFPPEQIGLLKTIGQQVGVAVENARLYEQAEHSAQIAERTRLARELHDSVTQSLYSMTLYAEATARLLTAGQIDAAAGHLRDLRDTAQEALREMRLLIFELRPPALENGLANALQNRLDSVESRGGIKAALRVQGNATDSLALQTELYHVALEALNNTLKHANAQYIQIDLRYDDDSTQLKICDDGIGFDPAIARLGGGLGLAGMRERVQRIGGTLEIDSGVGKGTNIRVRVPMHSKQNGETQ